MGLGKPLGRDLTGLSCERSELQSRIRRYTSPYCDVIRAKIVLLAAEGLENDAIAQRVDLPRQVVSKWRQRFYRHRLGGLDAEPRGGRPARFSPSIVVEVKRIACGAPRNLGLPLSKLTIPEVQRVVLERGLVASISGITIWRWLDADAIKPWRYRSWIFPRDPAFAERAGCVLDLYAGIRKGEPLNSDDFVISADEKTSIQARRRRHATTTPHPGGAGPSRT
jgi:transposase